jgi:hypothetical protein
MHQQHRLQTSHDIAATQKILDCNHYFVPTEVVNTNHATYNRPCPSLTPRKGKVTQNTHQKEEYKIQKGFGWWVNKGVVEG